MVGPGPLIGRVGRIVLHRATADCVGACGQVFKSVDQLTAVTRFSVD